MPRIEYAGSSAHWAIHKPGWKPDLRLIHRLRRVHPRVRLVYSPQFRQWALLERCLDGVLRMIRPLEGRPTVHNTIHFLNQVNTGRLRAPEEFDSFIDKLDASQPPEQTPEAEEALAEGHDRLWHEMGTDHQVALPRNGLPKKR